jgi:hypothetical protein
MCKWKMIRFIRKLKLLIVILLANISNFVFLELNWPHAHQWWMWLIVTLILVMLLIV